MRHLIQEYTTPHIGYKAGQQQAESAFVILLWERLRRWMDCDSISQIVSHSLQNFFYLHYSDPIVSRLRRQPVPLAALALMALFRYCPAWRAGRRRRDYCSHIGKVIRRIKTRWALWSLPNWLLYELLSVLPALPAMETISNILNPYSTQPL